MREPLHVRGHRSLDRTAQEHTMARSPEPAPALVDRQNRPRQGTTTMTTSRITRRAALQLGAATLAAPFVFRHHAHAAPSETLRHASFGASGMAWGDIGSLTASKKLKLVAVA